MGVGDQLFSVRLLRRLKLLAMTGKEGLLAMTGNGRLLAKTGSDAPRNDRRSGSLSSDRVFMWPSSITSGVVDGEQGFLRRLQNADLRSGADLVRDSQALLRAINPDHCILGTRDIPLGAPTVHQALLRQQLSPHRGQPDIPPMSSCDSCLFAR